MNLVHEISLTLISTTYFLYRRSRFFSMAPLVVVVVRVAPDIPEMSVPGVGYSFKPKGLAFVTPLYPV